MSQDADCIISMCKKVSKKLFFKGLFSDISAACLIAAAADVLIAASSLIFPIYNALLYMLLATAAGLIAAVVFRLFKIPSKEKAAAVIDSFGFQERTLTALENMDNKGVLFALQRKDAARILKENAGSIRIKLSPDLRVVAAALAGFALAFGLLMIPAPAKEKAADIHEAKLVAKETEEEIKQAIESLEKLQYEELSDEQMDELKMMIEQLRSSQANLSKELSSIAASKEKEKLDYQYSQMSKILTQMAATAASPSAADALQNAAGQMAQNSSYANPEAGNEGGTPQGGGENGGGGQAGKDGQSAQPGQDGQNGQSGQSGQDGQNGQPGSDISLQDPDGGGAPGEGDGRGSFGEGSGSSEQNGQGANDGSNGGDGSQGDGQTNPSDQHDGGSSSQGSGSDSSVSDGSGSQGQGESNSGNAGSGSGSGNDGSGNGQGGGSGQGEGGGNSDGGGNGSGSGGQSDFGDGNAMHDYVSIPNATGDDANLTGDITGHDNSQVSRAQNGLAWEGEHVDGSAVIGDYRKQAYEGIRQGRYPDGMKDVIRDYFDGFE